MSDAVLTNTGSTPVSRIIDQVRMLNADGREKLIEELREIMCMDCGRGEPGCQCWNDE